MPIQNFTAALQGEADTNPYQLSLSLSYCGGFRSTLLCSMNVSQYCFVAQVTSLVRHMSQQRQFYWLHVKHMWEPCDRTMEWKSSVSDCIHVELPNVLVKGTHRDYLTFSAGRPCGCAVCKLITWTTLPGAKKQRSPGLD